MKLKCAIGIYGNLVFLQKNPKTRSFAGVERSDLESIQEECTFVEKPGIYNAILYWENPGTEEGLLQVEKLVKL